MTDDQRDKALEIFKKPSSEWTNNDKNFFATIFKEPGGRQKLKDLRYGV